MRLFVTGGTGFLGHHVIEALLAREHEVDAMVRHPTARLPEGARPVPASLTDAGSLRAAITGCDAVVHLAGVVSRDPKDGAEMYAVHVEGTRTLLRAMSEAGVHKLVLASTSGTIAISDEPGPPMNEDDEPSFEIIGKWPYYSSKRIQEQEVLRWHKNGDIEAVILNPSLLLGPGDEKLSSSTDILNILNGRIPAYADGTIAFVDVRDCGPAFVAGLTAPSGQRYLLNGANMGIRQFIERVTLAGDVAPPRLRLSRPWAVAGAKVMQALYESIDRAAPVDAVSVDMSGHYWACDASRAKRVLGFTARDPQVTLTDTIDDLTRRGLFRRT